MGDIIQQDRMQKLRELRELRSQAKARPLETVNISILHETEIVLTPTQGGDTIILLANLAEGRITVTIFPLEEYIDYVLSQLPAGDDK